MPSKPVWLRVIIRVNFGTRHNSLSSLLELPTSAGRCGIYGFVVVSHDCVAKLSHRRSAPRYERVSSIPIGVKLPKLDRVSLPSEAALSTNGCAVYLVYRKAPT